MIEYTKHYTSDVITLPIEDFTKAVFISNNTSDPYRKNVIKHFTNRDEAKQYFTGLAMQEVEEKMKELEPFAID